MTDLMSDYPIRRPAGHRNGLLSGGDAPTESYGPSEANDQYRRPELRAAPMSWRDRLLVALKGRNENIDYERQLEKLTGGHALGSNHHAGVGAIDAIGAVTPLATPFIGAADALHSLDQGSPVKAALQFGGGMLGSLPGMSVLHGRSAMEPVRDLVGQAGERAGMTMEELAWRLQHLTNEKYGHGLERMGERVGDAFQRFGDPTNLRLDRLPWEDTVPAFSKNAQQLINQYSRPTKNPWDRPLP